MYQWCFKFFLNQFCLAVIGKHLPTLANSRFNFTSKKYNDPHVYRSSKQLIRINPGRMLAVADKENLHGIQLIRKKQRIMYIFWGEVIRSSARLQVTQSYNDTKTNQISYQPHLIMILWKQLDWLRFNCLRWLVELK